MFPSLTMKLSPLAVGLGGRLDVVVPDTVVALRDEADVTTLDSEERAAGSDIAVTELIDDPRGLLVAKGVSDEAVVGGTSAVTAGAVLSVGFDEPAAVEVGDPTAEDTLAGEIPAGEPSDSGSRYARYSSFVSLFNFANTLVNFLLIISVNSLMKSRGLHIPHRVFFQR
jgi:hypothetical protein